MNIFEPYPTQKYSPLGLRKPKTIPKLGQKIKARIEGSIGNKNCSIIRVDLKAVFDPYPNPQNCNFGPFRIFQFN